jgi:uncharacterized membrane protein
MRSFIQWLGCHQMPERSFIFRGVPMPVCSRCLGVVLGQVTAMVIAAVWALPNYVMCIILLIPMAIDWSLQEYAGIMSTNIRRCVTGFLGGLGFTCFALRLLFLLALWLCTLFGFKALSVN